MSIRGYIVKKETRIIDGKTFYHDNLTYCYNLWRQPEITEWLLQGGGEDYTNDDYIGTIEISRECFMEIFKRKNNNETNKTNQISLETIEKETKDNDWIVIQCL